LHLNQLSINEFAPVIKSLKSHSRNQVFWPPRRSAAFTPHQRKNPCKYRFASFTKGRVFPVSAFPLFRFPLALPAFAFLLLPFLTLCPAHAQTPATAHYLGAPSCASSSCHGGGGANQNQYLVWSQRDFHSQRPVATLATARSRQIAAALAIDDPTTEARCTTCHAPLAAVPADRRGPGFNVAEGVSCESCHGPAENWLIPHTRKDWTTADRVFAGMRNLQNLYVRANTCVACHQTLALPLLKAGHPELIFELDGQCVAEPKHWTEKPGWNRAQTWYVGQAVALRELSWQLTRETTPDDHLLARWRALVWLLQKLNGVAPTLPGVGTLVTSPSPDSFQAAQAAADSAARQAASATWSPDLSAALLTRLAATSGDFTAASAATPGELPARQAERLVLALDRLLLAQTPAAPAAASQTLNDLFKQAQSIPDFNPATFATTLTQFSSELK